MDMLRSLLMTTVVAGAAVLSAADVKNVIYADFEKGRDNAVVSCDSRRIHRSGFKYVIIDDHYTRGKVMKIIIPGVAKPAGKRFRVCVDLPIPPQKTLKSSIICDVRFSDPDRIVKDGIYAMHFNKKGIIQLPCIVQFGSFDKKREGWYHVSCPLSKMMLEGKEPFRAEKFNRIRVSFWLMESDKPLEFYIDNIGLAK